MGKPGKEDFSRYVVNSEISKANNRTCDKKLGKITDILDKKFGLKLSEKP